jgi:uncharacterized protein YjeT (DUF2065 family)
MLRSQRDFFQKSLTAAAGRTQMSGLFKFPHNFVRHDRSEVDNRTVTINALYELESVAGSNNRSAALRDDHIILAVIDGLFYLRASFKRWRNRRRTLRALADLDERQLRDIGLTRNDALFDVCFRSPGRHNDYRAFPEIDGTATPQNPQTRT